MRKSRFWMRFSLLVGGAAAAIGAFVLSVILFASLKESQTAVAVFCSVFAFAYISIGCILVISAFREYKVKDGAIVVTLFGRESRMLLNEIKSVRQIGPRIAVITLHSDRWFVIDLFLLESKLYLRPQFRSGLFTKIRESAICRNRFRRSFTFRILFVMIISAVVLLNVDFADSFPWLEGGLLLSFVGIYFAEHRKLSNAIFAAMTLSRASRGSSLSQSIRRYQYVLGSASAALLIIGAVGMFYHLDEITTLPLTVRTQEHFSLPSQIFIRTGTGKQISVGQTFVFLRAGSYVVGRRVQQEKSDRDVANLPSVASSVYSESVLAEFYDSKSNKFVTAQVPEKRIEGITDLSLALALARRR